MKIRRSLFGFLFITVISAATAHKLCAQNLIPNPGFEELFTQLEYQWVQPQGAFYHYESADSTNLKTAHSGQYINGLCMYNTVPNEYLHVKLLEPLEAGQKYRLEVFARLMRAKCSNAYEQKLIGAFIGNEKLDTQVPGDLYFDPQINLTLPDSNRFEWFQMVDTFEAKGGEQYLTMGYFPNTQLKEARDKAQEAYMREIERRYNASQKKTETKDMSWLYMAPDEQKRYLKEQKKMQKRRGNDEDPTNVDSVLSQQWAEKNETIVFKSDIPGVFASRYYFDDLCLVPIYTDGREVICQPENLPEEIAEGRTISLRNVFFKTDSASLLEESKFQLEALYKLMNEYDKMKIEIRGYTDNVGDDAYNLELSKRRATAVENWLIDKGINPSRISSQGFGKSDPVETNNTEAGRARNRRVTFYIVSM